MGTLIMIVGYGWALLGAGNILLMPMETMSEGWLTAGLMFNVLLFVLPGLAVGALGQNMRRRSADRRRDLSAKDERRRGRVEPKPPAR